MSKKSKLDLLVRVRHLNPLPPPPFPPKLFNIETDLSRLGDASYLAPLAAATQLPMMVDSEMGMALNLNAYRDEGVWDGNDRALLPPTRGPLHPHDQELLQPIRQVMSNAGPSKAADDVTWLRNTSYISKSDVTARKARDVEASKRKEAVVDASETAQLDAINASFLAATQPLSELKHPKKGRMKAVESFEILPDDTTWANNYVAVKFAERPSASSSASANPLLLHPSNERLSRALLRPLESAEGAFMSVYLPSESTWTPEVYDGIDEATEEQVAALDDAAEGETEVDAAALASLPHSSFDFARDFDYTLPATETDDLILTFYDGPNENLTSDEQIRLGQTGPKRKRGAYYKKIKFRTELKKRRIERGADELAESDDKWHKVKLGARTTFEEEKEKAEDSLRSIVDPDYNDALLREGEAEAEALGEGMGADED